jgi:hypothetical protein
MTTPLTMDCPCPAAAYTLAVAPALAAHALSSSVGLGAAGGRHASGKLGGKLGVGGARGGPRRSLHPCLVRGQEASRTEAGLPLATLDLPRLLPHTTKGFRP